MHDLALVGLAGRVIAVTREILGCSSLNPVEKVYIATHRLALIERGKIEKDEVRSVALHQMAYSIQRNLNIDFERVELLKYLALFTLDPKDSGLAQVAKQNGEPDVYLCLLKTVLEKELFKTLRTLPIDENVRSDEGHLGFIFKFKREIELTALEAEVKLVVRNTIRQKLPLSEAAAAGGLGHEEGHIDG